MNAAEFAALAVGAHVEAEWSVGPAQRWSGWVDADRISNPELWEVVEVNRLMQTIHLQVPGGGRIVARAGNVRLPKPTCCDGTGWTGNPRERCVDHYDAPDPIMHGRLL